VSHVLPVVMSLKHCLEATKSPLQGTLMEYLLSLVKHHKVEVDQALQNDPTLKAEVDYDLRQYEKNKIDLHQGK
jgi:condensin-2 complex subunit D3